MSDAFKKLVGEVRKDLGAREAQGVDWRAVDSALFARIEKERRAERSRFSSRAARSWAGTGVALVAAATVLAILGGRSRESTLVNGSESSPDEIAGTLRAAQGNGEGQVVLNGTVATGAAQLRRGDRIEARGMAATIDRPGKVTLILEPGARVAITHVQGALVVALEQGAVEAQVVPVPSGEAFAVDIESSRVAVHGTHLRVARDGHQVVVDLSEGVVSMGEAPRVGSMLGALVTAPAHAEFAAADMLDTLTVTHDPSAMRLPVALGGVVRARPPFAQQQFAAPRVDSNASQRVSQGSAGASHAETHSVQIATAQSVASASPADPNAEAIITTAVRACMADRPRAENVTVVVNTTLYLDLGDDGTVRAARFDPPVAPDVNGCAVQSIYRARFARVGTVVLPIDFKNQN